MAKYILALSLAITLAGCANAPIDYQAEYGVPFTNRTVPTYLVDEGIEQVATKNIPTIAGFEQIPAGHLRVAVDSFRREVLLTGEVPNQQVAQSIIKMVGTMPDVKTVHNYMTVAPFARTHAQTLQEGYLKSKILTKITASRALALTQYKIVVRNRDVYLLGYMTNEQQNHIIDILRSIDGIEKVFPLSTIIVDEEAPKAMYAAQTVSAPKSTSSLPTATALSTEAVAPVLSSQTNSLTHNPYPNNIVSIPNLTTPTPISPPATILNEQYQSSVVTQPNTTQPPATNQSNIHSQEHFQSTSIYPVVHTDTTPQSSYVKLYQGTDRP